MLKHDQEIKICNTCQITVKKDRRFKKIDNSDAQI